MSEFSSQVEESDKERYCAALDELPASEIPPLHRISLVAADFHMPKGEPVQEFDRRHGFLLGMVIDDYLDALPVRNLDRAKAVYEAFASNPNEETRFQIAMISPRRLTLVDHNAGIEFWDRLMRDPSPRVRFEARDEFAPDEPDLTEHWGLTSEDAERLDAAYRLAEHGENLHDPVRHAGEVALSRLAQIIDSQQQQA
jgi:hypothetical protein